MYINQDSYYSVPTDTPLWAAAANGYHASIMQIGITADGFVRISATLDGVHLETTLAPSEFNYEIVQPFLDANLT